jgi:putative aldouronate transport system permease protein
MKEINHINKKSYNPGGFGKRFKRDFYMNKWKYLMVLPSIIYFAIFSYKPMYGILIAFKDYKPSKGILGGDWVGLHYFLQFFNDINFGMLIRNTFSISILSIIFGFPAPILFALLLNEIKNTRFKRMVQTFTYLPHFISLVIICSLIRSYCISSGLFNQIIMAFGGNASSLLQNPYLFYPIYILSDIWQGVGWGSIIYLSALSGIDQEQYEAAEVDGAGRFRKMLYITLPGIMPTITIMFILRMGGILNVGYEKILLLYNPLVYSRADVISTYVYRIGLVNFQMSYSTAISLFNSLINAFFLILTNQLSKRFSNSSFL